MAGDMTVGSLRAILHLDNDQFNRGVDDSRSRFEQAGQRMTKVGDRMTGAMVGVGVAMAGAAVHTVNYAKEMGRAARESGLTVERVQETSMAMERLGVEQDTTVDGLREMTLRLGEAATEGGEAAEGFNLLGVDVKDANGNIRDSNEVLPEVLDKLTAMDSDARRSAAAAKTFGDEAGFAFAQVASRGGDLEEAMDAVRQSGAVMSDEGIAQAREMAEEWAASKQVLMGWMRDAAIPAMEFFTDDLVPVVKNDVVPALRTMKGMWDALPGPAQTAIGVMGGIVAVSGPIMSVAGRLLTMGTRARGALTRVRSLGRYLAGPWGVALGAAVAAVAVFADQQRDLRQATQFLRQELQGEEADLESLGDEMLVSKLRSSGLLTTLQDQGVTLDQVRQAITGNEDALNRLGRQMGFVREGTGGLSGAMRTQNHVYEMALDKIPGLTSRKHDLWAQILDLRKATDQHNSSLRAEDRLTNQVGTSTRDTRSEMEKMTAEMESAKKAADQLNTQFNLLFGTEVDLERATLQWRNQLQTTREQIDATTGSVDLNTAAGRDNRGAILDAIQAAKDHATAMRNNGASADDATAAFKANVDELLRVAEESGVSEQAIQSLREDLNLIPGKYEATIEADTGPSSTEVNNHRSWIESLPPSPMKVGADTGPARREIGSLENWILSQGLVDIGISAESVGDGPGLAVPPGGGSALQMARRAMEAVPGEQYITSTFRTPMENALAGGSPTSYHMDASNPAVDIGGENLTLLYQTLQRMGVPRELLGPGDPGHGDHVHIADEGATLRPGLNALDNRTGGAEALQRTDDLRPDMERIADAVDLLTEMPSEFDRGVRRQMAPTPKGGQILIDHEEVERAEDLLGKWENVRGVVFDTLDSTEQIANIERRMARAETWSDEWVQLRDQRMQIVEDERQAMRDLMDERETLERELADRREQYERDVAQARRDHQQRVAEEVARRREELAGQVDPLADVSRITDAGSRTHREGLFPTFSAIDSIEQRTRTLDEWGSAISDLRGEGFNQSMLSSLGVAQPGEQAVRQIESLLDSPRLAELREAFEGLDRQIGDQVASERAGDAPLGQSIDKMQTELSGDLRGLRADFMRSQAEQVRETVSVRREIAEQTARLEAAISERPTRSEVRDAVRAG